MAKAKKPRSARAEIKMWKGQVSATQDANAKLRNELSEAYKKVEIHDRAEGSLANENTRLGKLVESLKEQLFYKSIALAQAEGQLQRVDHEDAERAEVIFVNEMRTSKVKHDSGFEVNGPAVPIQRAVLKYNLDRQPMRTTTYEELHRPSSGMYSSRDAEAKPKHWVNQS